MKRTAGILSLASIALCVWTVVVPCGSVSVNAQSPQARSRPVKFTSYRLANGLRVLLAPDEEAAGAAVNLSFDVGSRNETPEQAGFANLLESIVLQNLHEMLQSERGEAASSDEVKQLQGTANQERTSYFSELAASRLEPLLSAFARQLQAPDLTQKRIDAQQLAILAQCREASENPFGRVQATLLELSYRKFPYKHHTACSLSNQAPLSAEAVRAFFKSHYAPNNAVLVIVGNFNVGELQRAIRKHFGTLQSRPRPRPVDTTDRPPLALERRRILNHAGANPPLYMSAYLTVPSDHRDWYALNLLGDIMGQGETSRLYVALVAKKLASSAPEGASELRGPSLFQVGARVSPGVSVEAVEAALDAEIARIRRDGVTAAEIERARLQERDYSIEQLRTPLGKANFLARSAIYYNNPNRINRELGRMLAVTAEDVRRVARKYLVKTNRAVVIVQP